MNEKNKQTSGNNQILARLIVIVINSVSACILFTLWPLIFLFSLVPLNKPTGPEFIEIAQLIWIYPIFSIVGIIFSLLFLTSQRMRNNFVFLIALAPLFYFLLLFGSVLYLNSLHETRKGITAEITEEITEEIIDYDSYIPSNNEQ